jgi:hypothetical protein
MNGLKKTFAIAAAVSMVCLSSAGAMAANKLIVKDSTGATDKFVVTDSGYVGVGGTPTYPITVIGAGTVATASIILQNNGRSPSNPLDSTGMYFLRGNVNSVNGGLPQANDRLGFFYFGAPNKMSAGVASYASANWTSTSFPSYVSIYSSDSINSLAERMRIGSVGSTGIVTIIGGALLNSVGTQPSCSSALRGTLWLNKVAAGTASGDVLQMCVQLPSSTSFGWRNIVITNP